MSSHVTSASERAGNPPARRRDAAIEVSSTLKLEGNLIVPPESHLVGAIAFPRICRQRREPSAYDRRAIKSLSDAGIATLSFDVWSAREKLSANAPTETDAIAERLAAATRFLREQPETARLALGYLATGAGSSAALLAAARLGEAISAVAAVGGEPHWAPPVLRTASAAVLLIVGGSANEIEAACATRDRLGGPTELVMIPGAGHMTAGDPRPHRRAIALATSWLAERLGDD